MSGTPRSLGSPVDAALDATHASHGDPAPNATHAGAAPRGPATMLDELPVAERYQITDEVGHGGIGRVLRARDRVLDRPVAVKELFASDDGAQRRFVREALITARLQHPSIVPIYKIRLDFGAEEAADQPREAVTAVAVARKQSGPTDAPIQTTACSTGMHQSNQDRMYRRAQP